MSNRQFIEDRKHLKQFINLYKKCTPVNRLTKVQNEEFRVFSLKNKGLPISFGNSKKLLELIPQREGLYDFWRQNEYFWIIPMEIFPNQVYGFTVRGYEKSYNVFRMTSNLPVLFGLYDFEDFDFNRQPLILCEGIKDSLVLKTIYPYTIALNTAGLTTNSLNFIKAMTKRVILIYDNDKAGTEASIRDIEALRNEGIRVIDIKLRLKDAGKYIDNPSELQLLDSNIKQYL